MRKLRDSVESGRECDKAAGQAGVELAQILDFYSSSYIQNGAFDPNHRVSDPNLFEQCRAGQLVNNKRVMCLLCVHYSQVSLGVLSCG